MYQLSILIPSKYPEKLARLLKNLRDTMARFEETEIVICEDGMGPTTRNKNYVRCYSPPSSYRSTFHEKPALIASGKFLMMANDDIEFKTPNWDLMIPYDKFPDELVLFHFKDSFFNQNFACHPIFSRRLFEIAPDILSPLYHVTKCDNTIWDIHPAARRIYLEKIEIKHYHEELGKEFKQAYMADDREYARNQDMRDKVRKTISKLIGMKQKILIGVPTGPEIRRPEFYDYYNMIHRPPGSLSEFVHGPSIAKNRNLIVEAAIQNKCTHIFFLDDDVTCNPDVIYQLLKHDKDIVTGVLLGKSFPHRPYLFTEVNDDHMFIHYKLNDKDTGLIPMKGAGLGIILMKIEVFNKIEAPWFRYSPYIPDQLGEDLYFFDRLDETDVEVYCDLDCTAMHFAHVGVRPFKNEKGWHVIYETGGENTVNYLHTEQVVGAGDILAGNLVGNLIE
jgi:hypothetical protein